ncbi:MAG TPA: long-chain-fatty-acid--CoA ligase [Ktedonobacteraceae bacterium]|nr:long-chain-fatty-acid--CoA ligase [Ktedonobacteraceae bacterium]
MNDISVSVPTRQSRLDLFRPSLSYPSYQYDEMLTQAAQHFPENEALIFPNVNLTYREMDALVNALSNALLDLGLRKGQPVCLFMKNCPEFLISWFAIARIGAIVSPINPAYKEREFLYQLSNSDAVAIIVQHEFLPMVEAIRVETPTLQYILTVGESQQPLPPHVHSFSQLVQTYPATPPTCEARTQEDILALPYSSGTTGLPKGVMHSHKSLVCNTYQMVSACRVRPHDRLLVFLPLYHIFGIKVLGVAALSGATIVLMERFDAEECLRLIQEQGITVFYAVPRILALLSDHPRLKDYDVHTVRYVLCGAAPVPPPLARRFQELTHITVLTGFGTTEANATHNNPVIDPRLVKVETIGLPIHDTKHKIVDIETGQKELGVGEEGELIIQGPQIMQGYWKAPEATAEALRDGWLYTGDIARRDEDGYITITDRKKEMIKYKGFSIAPAQIEALLLEHPAVADVAIIAKPNDEAGEIPKAFVVRRREYEHVSEDELMLWVNKQLATFKHVREISFIDAIPRNPTGKILRRVLKEQEQQKMA